MKIDAIFFDFDWTLFDHKTKQIPTSTVDSLKKIKDKGIKIYINSARSYYALEGLKTFEKIDFDGYVCQNGGTCFLKDKILYNYSLNKDTYFELLKLANENNFSYLIKTRTKEYIKVVEQNIVDEFYSIFYEAKPLDILEFDIEKEEPIVFQIFTKEEFDANLKDISNININRFSPIAVEITSKAFFKDKGINQIINFNNFNKENIMAFGDDLNDIPMFNLVKYGICMGNGNSLAKKHAYFVTTNIEDNGITYALEYFNLI